MTKSRMFPKTKVQAIEKLNHVLDYLIAARNTEDGKYLLPNAPDSYMYDWFDFDNAVICVGRVLSDLENEDWQF